MFLRGCLNLKNELISYIHENCLHCSQRPEGYFFILAKKIPITIDIYTRKEYQQHIGALCLLRGKSPRGDFGHVIVARFTSSGFGCPDSLSCKT